MASSFSCRRIFLIKSHEGPFLSQLDDDLALRTSGFDISHSLFGPFEWKDPIHNRAYDPGIDERTDLA